MAKQEYRVKLENCSEFVEALVEAMPGISASCSAPWILTQTDSGMELTAKGVKQRGPLKIDFCDTTSQHKRKTLTRGQIFAKAMGPNYAGSTVVDLTAGLGGDAFSLAVLGFNVIAIERNPILFLLLRDALERWEDGYPEDEIVKGKRLSVVYSDSAEYLSDLTPKSISHVYYDPMFPEKKKSALSSGSLQWLQELNAHEEPVSQEILKMVQYICSDRFVIKRPLKAEELLPSVTNSYTGKSVRYDMYKCLKELPQRP